jgi:hypothetical protein
MLFYLFSMAEQTKLNEKVNGIWFGPNETDIPVQSLDASWIWVNEDIEAHTILARKTFSLYEGFKKVVLRITASSQYQLFVNGEYVCRGPARCAPHHQSYDVLDITKMMKAGENLIAVRVHHQKGTISYQYQGRAGLLAKITFSQGESYGMIPSDSSWKVIPDSSWDNNAPAISRFQQVVNDRIDFRNYLHDWENLDFDDSNWQAASELMRKTGWPAPQKNAPPQPLTPPWTSLVARDIPYLMEENIPAENLIEARLTDTKNEENPIFLTGNIEIKSPLNSTIELPESGAKSWFLLFDFGEVINGMPQLDIQGKAGIEVEIITAPFILDKQFTHITVDSEFRDKIILSGERDQWESTYFKPTRYLGIRVKNNAVLRIHSAGIHQIKYPFEMRGKMSSEDAPWINNYFEASAKTINVCTTDAFTDNYRERRQYAQTGYYAALGNYYTFGDKELQRRCLIQIAQEQLANGIMPAYAPLANDDFMIILDSNCFWLRGLRNYFMYSGDELTVRELLPAAQKLIDFLHSFTSELYFIENPPFAYWLDHTQNDRRGTNLCLNGHYLGALTDYTEILHFLGIEDKELNFQIEAAALSYTHFWDEEKQLYVDAISDNCPSELFSEHGNAMALSKNNVWKEEAELAAKQILINEKHNFIKRESGITMVTPAMSYSLHKGLCNYGYVKESFEMFRTRFDKMLEENTNQTLWEEWWLNGTGRTGKFQGGRTRSDAQTESAFPPALFAEFIVGITPVKPGLKEWKLQNIDSGVQQISATIPSGKRNIEIEWNRKNQKKTLLLNIPEGVIINVDLNSLQTEDKSEILCNKKKLFVPNFQETDFRLEKGNYTIEF